MPKIKSKWICQNCGYESSGYLGKCPDCSSWGSLTEEPEMTKKISNGINSSGILKTPPQLLKDISIRDNIRHKTGISEFDNVLGGGIVKGSLVLLGGDPGIGKSTLTLQACGNFANNGLKTIYVSAEESEKQIKIRSERLNINSDNLYVLSETNIEDIKNSIISSTPEIIIIDSIQAVYSSELSSSPGSVSQIRECCNVLLEISKSSGIPVILIGHVTKDGIIAGPKVLEHMVDTVLYFEGDRYKSYRILRAIKNRFGSTGEIGLFNMEAGGLIEINNPGSFFLSERKASPSPGSVIIACTEGNRPVFTEIQALVGPTSYPSPRRVATGIEYNRVLQILAVLERRVGLNLSKHDVYVNATGGMDIQEPAADLGIALAVATCARNVVIDSFTAIAGEVGLSGEIRRITAINSRINEAAKTGFKKIIVPSENLPLKEKIEGITIIGVTRLLEAITNTVSH